MTFLRISMGCGAILLYAGLFHYRIKSMPLRSVRIFNWIYLLSLVNILSGSAVICASECTEPAAVWLGYGGRAFFLVSLAIMLYLFYRYITSVFADGFVLPARTRVTEAIFVLGAVFFVLAVFPVQAASSVVVMLAVLGMMLGKENPQRYMDMQTGIFNQYALLAALNECVKTGGEYYTGVIAFDSSLHGYWLFGAYQRYFHDVNELLSRKFRYNCYRVTENGIVFLSRDEQECHKALKDVEKLVRSAPELYRCASVNLRTSCIVSRKEERDYNILMQELTTFCRDVVNKMDYLDLMTNAKNRNSFEMDWENIRAEDGELWYVIFDANNLKVVNDTYGHSQGDELLQTMAGVLSEGIGLNGQVYRIGGDEFVALWQPDGEDIHSLLERIRTKVEQVNRRRSIPLEFATGYVNIWTAPSKEEAKNIADRMMYAVKKEMKGEVRNSQTF